MQKLKKLLKNEKDRHTEELGKIDLLNKQVQEYQERLDDRNYNEFSDSIINSASIHDFWILKSHLSKGNVSKIVASRKLLKSFQKLVTGLLYGVIPIAVPQRIMLTEEDKKLIKDVEKATNLTIVKKQISKNKVAFSHILTIISDSIKYLQQVQEKTF